jgi:5-methylcytosine-specific restriction endonuclease McrA
MCNRYTLGSKERMLEHFKKNIGVFISLNDLRRISEVNEFARQIRLLRQEGWDIQWKWHNGTTWYCLKSLIKRETGKNRTPIDDKTRYRILQRDNSTCQRCGRTPADGMRLDVDHKIPVDWGGSSEDSNLWTLCRECNEGKKAFFSDFDAEIMKSISGLSSGGERLKEFIRRNYEKPLPVYILQVIAHTREWTRELRRLRQSKHFDYKINRKEWTYTFTPVNLTPISKKA